MKKVTLNLLAILSVAGSVRAVDIVEPISTQEEFSVVVVSVGQADDIVPQEEENVFEKYKKAIIDYVREHKTEVAIISAAVVATVLAVCYRNSMLAVAAAKEEELWQKTVPPILQAQEDLRKLAELKKIEVNNAAANGTVPQPNPQQPEQQVANQVVVPVDSQDTNKASWDLDQAKAALWSVGGYLLESIKTVKLDTEN